MNEKVDRCIPFHKGNEMQRTQQFYSIGHDTPEIFILHSNKDKVFVSLLHKFLCEHGHKAWYCGNDITIGANWRNTIYRTIYIVNHVIVVISENLLSKRGFYNYELQIAQELYQNKGESSNFIIPIRIDDYRISGELTKLQYLDCWISNDWHTRLMASLA